MLDAETILDLLENNYQSIRSSLGSRWTEFGGRGGALADRFKRAADLDDPEAAARALESAVNKLLRVCRDYAYVADLLGQAERAFLMAGPDAGNFQRPPAARQELDFDPKEIATRYLSLLARLKATSDGKR